MAHIFSLRLAQDLHHGFELLSICSIDSGAPFTVYSGVQQTDAGTNGADRPNQVGIPHLSTARRVREDYFRLGDGNPSYFEIPIHVADGMGPNQGRYGSLGRPTFGGPAYYDYDFALIKDTPLGRRARVVERIDLQFRAEFFNLFNIVNLSYRRIRSPAPDLERSAVRRVLSTRSSSLSSSPIERVIQRPGLAAQRRENCER